MEPSKKKSEVILGTASNCRHPGETFRFVDYDAWKGSLQVTGRGRWQAYLQLLKDKPVLGYRIADREVFWRRVRSRDYVVFEHLAPALIGLGNFPYLPPVPVYNEFAALSLLAEVMEPSDLNQLPVSTFYEDNIKSLDLGDRTPWFVRPTNWNNL